MDKNELNKLLSQVEPGMTHRQQRELIVAMTLTEEISDPEKARRALDKITIEELEFEVERLSAALNRDVLTFINEVVAPITDEYAAVDCIEQCNTGWFKALILTDQAKIDLAKALIQACYPFVKRAVPTLWTNLALGFPETVENVRFTVEDAS